MCSGAEVEIGWHAGCVKWGLGWHALHLVGWASTPSIDVDLAWVGAAKASAGQGSIASSGIWSKNGLVERKRKGGEKKVRERERERRENMFLVFGFSKFEFIVFSGF